MAGLPGPNFQIRLDRDCGDEFKIRFVLMVLGALLCLAMKFVVRCSFFHYLEDPTSIKKINRPKKYSSSLYEANTTLSPRKKIER